MYITALTTHKKIKSNVVAGDKESKESTGKHIPERCRVDQLKDSEEEEDLTWSGSWSFL
jgi:hypothetical protein